jgi:hypothetical protein
MGTKKESGDEIDSGCFYHTILANQANLAGTLENIAHGTTLTLQFTAY